MLLGNVVDLSNLDSQGMSAWVPCRTLHLAYPTCTTRTRRRFIGWPPQISRAFSIDSSTIEAAQCFEKVHWGYQERQHITRSAGSWVDLWVTINIHLSYTKNIQLMYPYTINIYQYLSVNPVNPVDVSVFHVFPCFIHYILYPQKISSWSFCIPCFQSELGGVFKKKPKAWYSKDGRLWFEHHLESWRCQELQGWANRFLEKGIVHFGP